jgi:hypothetical protein
LLLIPDRPAVFLPGEYLEAVPGPIPKDEPVARQRIAAEGLPHQGPEAVKALAKIDRIEAKEDSQGRRKAQHVASSRRATRSRITLSATVGARRRRRPLRRTTSIGASSVDGGVGRAMGTNVTGAEGGFAR